MAALGVSRLVHDIPGKEEGTQKSFHDHSEEDQYGAVHKGELHETHRATARMFGIGARGAFDRAGERGSVGGEGALVVDPKLVALILFPEVAIAGYQGLDLGAHEAAEAIFGSARNRLAPYVEAGIDEEGTAG